MSDTATTHGARDHARAQESSAAARLATKPTIPVRDAVDLPAGFAAADLVWDETLGPGGYAARLLERGTRLRLDDVDGDACANVLIYNADQPSERLNVADTLKVQWYAYLGAGSLLLSDMGRVLMSIRADSGGGHDALCGASNARGNAAKYGDGSNYGPAPNARDRFALALAKLGLGKRDICPNINFFKSVTVGADGSLVFAAAAATPGRAVELRAEMRVLFVVANTPHVLDPRPTYSAGRLRLVAARGPTTAADDAVRNSTPERRRAFLNTEDYYTR
jgi:urea carboxylase-associated protein 2